MASNKSKSKSNKQSSVHDTLEERKNIHGDFSAIAEVAQDLKFVLHNSPNWDSLTPAMKESLEMQAHKQARILAGTPELKDSWHDIAGYAILVEQDL